MGQAIATLGIPLGAMQTHLHLGRLLACNDNDLPAIQSQLKKARSHQGSLSRIPVREGATPMISVMFYKAVVQAVFFCGCESWVVTDKVWEVLESFHHGAAQRTAGKMPCEVGEECVCSIPLRKKQEKMLDCVSFSTVWRRDRTGWQCMLPPDPSGPTVCAQTQTPTSVPAESCVGQMSCCTPLSSLPLLPSHHWDRLLRT